MFRNENVPMKNEMMSLVKHRHILMKYNAYFVLLVKTQNYIATLLFLAHLSRRLIGELLVYRGIRRPSVRRPSSTFSNDFFSEAAGPILLIFHI